jgi:phosphotransferase system enzyme I (PtsI)
MTTAGRRHLITGVAVSSGIAIGPAQFINRRDNAIIVRQRIRPEEVAAETARLDAAVETLVREFSEAQAQLRDQAAKGSRESREQADIIEAHIMICRDPKLLGLARSNISEREISAEWGWEKAVQEMLAAFANIDSPYLRERAADLQAVSSRVTACLRGNRLRLSAHTAPKIFFAHDLTPADTLALAPENIIALVTEMGGKTSHTGILARSLRIPCVVGCPGLEEAVIDEALVIVDGINGFVIINPREAELAEYREQQSRFSLYESDIRKQAALPAESVDGVRVSVYGNLETSRESVLLKEFGGEGVGLYRTEFGFLSRHNLPTENELFEDYRRIVEEMAPHSVVLRTLDAGADKMIGQRQRVEEENPALGLRAIRYCMRHQDIFRRQLRAMLRASVYGNAAIMFPMISGLSELRLAKSILSEVKQELDNEGTEYNRHLPLGSMIELPAAVFVAEALAREVDFFSIGTNDLIQYSLGIDRGNKYVSYLYQPLHPAIILAIKHVVDMARQAGISVCVCGEMAADPYSLAVLLGMGIDEFSVTPRLIPFVKNLIRRSDVAEFRDLARQVYRQNSAESVLRLIRQNIYGRFSGELSFFAAMTGSEI